MAASWWDKVHCAMWRVADRPDLLAIIHSARRVAREVVAPQLAAGARSGCEWTAEKQRILASLDASGLTSILSSASQGIATPLALAAWELAWVDGGAATLNLSGSLAQMPIRDFGTKEQQNRYLGHADRRHAALCLTEPIPGAGTDAMFLTGSFRAVKWVPGSEPVLEINKRGRFISHMDFADFVVAAVQGRGDRVRGSCLVILEPGDAGEFDRGSRVHKLGHQLASTTNPIFGLRVPASRIVGGFTIDNGVVVPNFDHRRLLEPAFRRTRSIMSLMTASKLLSTVEPSIDPSGETGGEPELREQLVDLWVTGEAAASLGFSAARLSDELDRPEFQTDARTREAAVLAPAAKLFSSSSAAVMLQRAAALGGCGPMNSGPGCVRDKLVDAQIEALYLGPEALQRRLVSAAMIDGEFLIEFQAWTEEMDRLAESLPQTGIRSLTAAMRLWHWTLLQLRLQRNSRGAPLFCDARQGVTFPMADALCGLLAARSLTLDVLELDKSGRQGAVPAFVLSIFFDLSTIASVRATGLVEQTCTALLLGYDGRVPLPAVTRSAFDDLRKRLNMSLCGTVAARDRVARFLRAEHES
jgi:alkylation response protein AidB-like acyl-CoA dehydrogenase